MPRALKPPTPERAALEQSVETALARRDFVRASKIVAEYEAQQPVSRGIGIDWANRDASRDVCVLDTIYGPPPGILRGVTLEALHVLRFAAAMHYLFGGFKRRWLPDSSMATGTRLDADSAKMMLVFAGYARLRIEGMKPVLTMASTARSSCVPDSCDVCKHHATETFYVASLPELPHPECTHTGGCRCIYTIHP